MTPSSSTRRAPASAQTPDSKRAVRTPRPLPATPPTSTSTVTELNKQPSNNKPPQKAREKDVIPEAQAVGPQSDAQPRVVKKRAPSDLSGQYGRAEKAVKNARVSAPVEPVKTVLRGKAAREAKEQRRAAMAVSDAVLERLRAKSETQSAPLVIEEPEVPRRGRAHECGKCGVARKFSTPAAVCNCGAILVKA